MRVRSSYPAQRVGPTPNGLESLPLFHNRFVATATRDWRVMYGVFGEHRDNPRPGRRGEVVEVARVLFNER